MELTQEDKDFLENKFGENSRMEDVTEVDYERFRKIKERYDIDIRKEKVQPIRTLTPEKSIDGIYTHTCNRCGYSWETETETPNNCANCKSRYWNKPRKNKMEHTQKRWKA